MMIGTATLRERASAWIRSIWWLLPSTSAVGVAPVGLVEDRGDDARGVVHDAGGQPLFACARSGTGVAALRVVARQDVGRGTRNPWRSPGAAHRDASRHPCRHRTTPADHPPRRLGVSVGVEGVEVDGGPCGEVFDLPFPELLPGGPLDRLHGTVEGAP